MGRPIVFYTVLWVVNNQSLRTTDVEDCGTIFYSVPHGLLRLDNPFNFQKPESERRTLVLSRQRRYFRRSRSRNRFALVNNVRTRKEVAVTDTKNESNTKMGKIKFRNSDKVFLNKSGNRHRACFFFGLIAISFVFTIFVQGIPIDSLKNSGLKLLFPNSRTLLSIPPGPSSNVWNRDPLESLFLVVPYRNRAENRRVFLAEIQKYLKRKVKFFFRRTFRAGFPQTRGQIYHHFMSSVFI